MISDEPTDFEPRLILSQLTKIQYILTTTSDKNLDLIVDKIISNSTSAMDEVIEILLHFNYIGYVNNNQIMYIVDKLLEKYGKDFKDNLFDALTVKNGRVFKALVDKGVYCSTDVDVKVNIDPSFEWFFGKNKIVIRTHLSNTQITLPQFFDDRYDPNSLEYILYKDDIEALKAKNTDRSFSFNQNVTIAPFEQVSDKNCHIPEFAALYGAEKCFDYIVENGGYIDSKVAKYSIRGKSLPIFLKCVSAGVDIKDCLLDAISMMRDDIFDIIINQAGADFLSLQLHQLIETRNLKLIIYYIDRRNDLAPTPKDLAACITTRQQSLFACVVRGLPLKRSKTRAADYFHLAAHHNCAGVCRTLLSKGADIDAEDERGETPLFYAARNFNSRMVRFLTANGASPNHLDGFNNTALHIAVGHGDYDTSKALLDGGADPNLPQCRATRPLHTASQLSKSELCALLLVHGADPTAKDPLWKTALDYAADADIRLMLEDAIRKRPKGVLQKIFKKG